MDGNEVKGSEGVKRKVRMYGNDLQKRHGILSNRYNLRLM